MSGHRTESPSRRKDRDLREVAQTFLRLGCTSFGGPIAHLGYLRAEFVERRKWLDDARYAELVALCQFLPGPASSQVVFALGLERAGLRGACLASLCFTAPSALLMLGFGVGVRQLGNVAQLGVFRGLCLAAVAVVAVAVWDMSRKLCSDGERRAIALAAAVASLALPGALAQILVIAVGGLLGAWLYRPGGPRALVLPAGGGAPVRPGARRAATYALVVFVTLLAGLPALAHITDWRSLDLVDAFYRSGSLVFGGGHVILPLLREEVVLRGWLGDSAFLAGYGAAQALPGPLMAFAAFVGAAIDDGAGGVSAGLVCLFAILLPGLLAVAGALPFWDRLRRAPVAQAGLAGATASVVGILLGALVNPLATESVRKPADAALVFVSVALLARWKVPSWAIVVLAAVVGQALAVWSLG